MPSHNFKFKWLVRAILISGLILLVYVVFFSEKIKIGDKVPEYSLKTLSNQKIDSGDFSGRHHIIHFWANWCDLCLEEITGFNAVRERFSDKLHIVAVHLGADTKDREAVLKLVEEKDLEYNIYMDDGLVSEMFGIRMVPVTFVVDDNGVVIQKINGANDWSSKESLELLERILNNSGSQ